MAEASRRGRAVLGVADELAAALMELLATGTVRMADGGIGLEGDAHRPELTAGPTSWPARGSRPLLPVTRWKGSVWSGAEVNMAGSPRRQGRQRVPAQTRMGATKGPVRRVGGPDRKQFAAGATVFAG